MLEADYNRIILFHPHYSYYMKREHCQCIRDDIYVHICGIIVFKFYLLIMGSTQRASMRQLHRQHGSIFHFVTCGVVHVEVMSLVETCATVYFYQQWGGKGFNNSFINPVRSEVETETFFLIGHFRVSPFVDDGPVVAEILQQIVFVIFPLQ